MSFLVKEKKKNTCWLNNSNFKSEFARGINNYGLDFNTERTITAFFLKQANKT